MYIIEEKLDCAAGRAWNISQRMWYREYREGCPVKKAGQETGMIFHNSFRQHI